MKKWIRIKNKKTVHRLFLEVIGLGTKKKSDKSTVGQWASGFKLATPAALRLGIEVIATSTDIIGPFVLMFDTKEISVEHGEKSITDQLVVYNYNDGRIAYAPVALGAFSEWSKAIGDDGNPLYPILREYIANARDEDKNFIWETGIYSVTQAEPGTSAVYVAETSEALDILLTHPNRYFKFLDAMPLFRVMGIGAIYVKSSPNETRCFNDGYLVDCKTDDEFSISIFDYDAYGKDIVNELRSIKSHDVFYGRLAKLFTRIRDKDALRRLILFACDNTAAIEREIFSHIDERDVSDNFRKLCKEIWEEGDRRGALLSCGVKAYDSYMRTLGNEVVSFESKMNGFFEKIGIKTSRMAYEDRLKDVKFRNLTPTEHARLVDIAMRYFLRIENYKQMFASCPIGVMHDPALNYRGLCTESYSSVYLADNIFSDEDVDFLATLCHELDHYETKRHDSEYIELMRHKDHRNARNLMLLSVALNALENAGVDISTLHPDFISTKK